VTRRTGESLATLARVKREAEDAAAKALRAARDRLDSEQERLQTVRRYVDDYRGHGAGDALQWQRLRDGQQFLLQLEFSLESQRAVVDQERRNVETARARWLALRLQRAAVDKLIDRRVQASQAEERRSEQRQSDELAARASTRTGEGSSG
jgi:flagellar protein FliJ